MGDKKGYRRCSKSPRFGVAALSSEIKVKQDARDGAPCIILVAYISFTPSTNALSLRLRLGCRSLRSALASI